MTGAWGMTMGGWIWMGVWIVALLVMVWILVRPGGRPDRDDPLDILRARYARGEISDDEYRHGRELLDSPARGVK